jgi:acyl transferase domain-containing protein/acyl carrier protein
VKGAPVLSSSTWKRVLEDEGFGSVTFRAPQAHDFGQQIIVAESDGRIRRHLSDTRPQATFETNGQEPLSITQTIESGKETSSTMKTIETGSPSHGSVDQGTRLRDRARAYLKQVIADTLKIPSHKIGSSESFEAYGIDSINIVHLTSALEKDLGELDSTLFFEYQTIDAVVDHFIASHRKSLVALLGDEPQSKAAEASSPKEVQIRTVPLESRLRPAKSTPSSGLEDRTPAREPAHAADPVAIVGIAGRYPQAEDLSSFWGALQSGKNCITEIPRDRWQWERYFDPERGKWGSTYTKWGGFLKDIDKFDPLFFQISPVEAQRMDPQERLFLEIAYASIEDAGYTPGRLSSSRKVGVFVGVMNSTYKAQSAHWSIANRVSYSLDFQGPSMAVDTACSASLTAIHLAVESIHSGTSECAIAGGVNLIIDPVHYFGLSLPRMLSATDECKPFGDQADGFVDGEGVGAVVLKPLRRALAEGDHIYGIIRGTAVNAGGKTNGFTVPNPNAQSRLIVDALERANVHPRTVSYVEAQATGTILGDPIEIAGLKRAFEKGTDDKGFCAIGSVKSNIGHGESAAGIAAITKVLLQLQHGKLVPSIHSETLNPKIRFENTPFVVQQELADWTRPRLSLNGESREYPRIAGVSSFGAGGANAHVVIEEFREEPHEPLRVADDPYVLIPLSARNEEGLKRVVGRLHDSLKDARRQKVSPRLEDLAFTLQVGRVAMAERLAMMVRSIAELEEKLKKWMADPGHLEGVHRARAKRNTEISSLFDGDEELHEATAKWLQKRKLTKLMELWLLGLDVDWSRLYEGGNPRRIALPTYPFARERYWLADSDRKDIGTSVSDAPAGVER